MKRNPYTGQVLHRYWFVYLFGGLRKLPESQGGGHQWAPNLLRRTIKYYREGWRVRYSLRRWLSLDRM